MSKNELVQNSSTISDEELTNVSGGIDALVSVLCKNCGGIYRLIPEYPGKDLSKFPVCVKCGKHCAGSNHNAEGTVKII